jgi:hypothetical protein
MVGDFRDSMYKVQKFSRLKVSNNPQTTIDGIGELDG